MTSPANSVAPDRESRVNDNHMRLLFAATLGYLIGACTSPKTPATNVSALDLESKTVALATIREDGTARAYCSGVWVAEDLILTADHCLPETPSGQSKLAVDGVLVAEPASVTVTFAVKDDVIDGAGREREHPVLRLGTVTARKPAWDLALVRVKGQTSPHGVARVATDGIYPGAKAFTMGHPVGLWWSYSSGDVAAVRQIDIDPEIVYVQTTAPTSRGNSGCGLFDENGFLIGIAHAGIPSASNLAFYVHGSYIQSFLVAKGPKL